jgi:lysozyme family protein
MPTLVLPSSPNPRALYCIGVIVGFEGGLVNNADDPGGITKFGISKRSYPKLDIANLTVAQAQAIYYKDYWIPSNAGHLPNQLDLYVFDAAVNQGVREAIIMLQAAAGMSPAQQDGVAGPLTLLAGGKVAPQRYLAERIMRYAVSPQFHQFGIGWIMRMFNLTSR